MGYRIIKSSAFDMLVEDEKRSLENPDRRGPIAASTGRPKAPADDPEQRIAGLESRCDEKTIREIIGYATKARWRTIDLLDAVSGSDRVIPCSLCGHKPDPGAFDPVLSACSFLGGKFNRHRCPNCEAISGPQKMLRLDAEMVDPDYRDSYRNFSEGTLKESVIRAFHLLKPGKNGVYLDFGFGGGWSEAIAHLRMEGWEFCGFEPNARYSSSPAFSTWAEVEAGNLTDSARTMHLITFLIQLRPLSDSGNCCQKTVASSMPPLVANIVGRYPAFTSSSSPVVRRMCWQLNLGWRN
jgi:hypothetical protein